MGLVIDYESEGFPAGAPVSNGSKSFTSSWDDLLWSALTVGRPNRQYIFQHGLASCYEALFRLSMVRMALEQRGPTAKRVRRTDAARTLDPTEKGAINYFLGLVIAKLFASELLDAPWLLHLDVFRPLLNPVLTKRSRPDLVGQTTGGRWLALECKGRGSKPDETAKSKAKDQALRLTSVNGVTPWLQVGSIAYFRNDVLQFTWRDPPAEPKPRLPIELHVALDQWRYHYLPVLHLVSSEPAYLQRMQQEPILMPVQSADISVGIHPIVLKDLLEKRWDLARQRFFQERSASRKSPYHLDGIAVVAGPTWDAPLVEPLE